MDKEQQIAKEIETYRKAAAENKSIDVASLMIQALEKSSVPNTIPIKSKRWAYLISLALPPFGLYFALKYYFSNYDDGKDTAMFCIILTAMSVLIFAIIFKSMLAGSGASLEQIQQIRPSDIQQTFE